MLQTLEQPTPVVEAEIQEPAPIPQAMDITPPIPQESSPVPTFSVESFTQPTVMDTTSTIIEPKVSIAPKKKSSVMPA